MPIKDTTPAMIINPIVGSGGYICGVNIAPILTVKNINMTTLDRITYVLKLNSNF